ncbi:cryptochrome/photolyase family protein [Actinophytocola sediminis]
MRRAAAELGDRATLIRADTYRAGLTEFGVPVLVHEPGSHAAARLVEQLCDTGLVLDVLPTPGFALSTADFATWVGDRKRFLLEDFYRDQRRRFRVLLEPDGEPVGGSWNLDKENRQRPPKQSTLDVPAPYTPREDAIDDEVRTELDELAAHGRIATVGADGPRLFAASPAQARRALRRFLDTRLATFGG